MTSASAALRKYWYQLYGLVISGSSHSFPPPVDLPNLLPSASVTSGTVRAWTVSPSSRRLRSTPETMFPHWSLPPIWSRQSISRRRCTKSFAWSSM